MTRRFSKLLVIDACVAGASYSGKEAIDPTAKDCRDFLEHMREKTPHRLVMTADLSSEWKKHASEFATDWLFGMVRKGRQKIINCAPNPGLRASVTTFAQNISEKRVTEMLKDAHLIEAALVTDKRIISIEKLARNWYADASKTVKQLSTIAWVDPSKADERPIAWLEKGAPADKARMLGAWSSNQ